MTAKSARRSFNWNNYKGSLLTFLCGRIGKQTKQQHYLQGFIVSCQKNANKPLKKDMCRCGPGPRLFSLEGHRIPPGREILLGPEKSRVGFGTRGQTKGGSILYGGISLVCSIRGEEQWEENQIELSPSDSSSSNSASRILTSSGSFRCASMSNSYFPMIVYTGCWAAAASYKTG